MVLDQLSPGPMESWKSGGVTVREKASDEAAEADEAKSKKQKVKSKTTKSFD